MPQPSSKRTFRILVGILAALTMCVVGAIGVLLYLSRPPSEIEIAATLTAMPSPTLPPKPTPTPIPTLPGVTEELLVCQRQAGIAMNARQMVGAVNLSQDHELVFKWVSTRWEVRSLDDALAGVILGFDVAVEIWDEGCAVFDRVRVEAYDRNAHEQTFRLSAQARMDDILKWRAGDLSDTELIARLEVTPAGP